MANALILSLACAMSVAIQGEKPPAPPADASALKLVATIAMPNVVGRIDHMALDPHPGSGTLLVACSAAGI